MFVISSEGALEMATGMFSHDADDMMFYSLPVPIGIREQATVLIDHRGFLPISGISKTKEAGQWKSISAFFSDIYQWFALPTANIIYLCFGLEPNEYFETYEDFSFIEESELDLNSDQAELQPVLAWIRFAHELCRSQGPALFAAAGGWSGFETAEAVATVAFRNRLLLFVSMRYRTMERKGTGQFLSAFEFLDPTFEFVNHYPIYSTATFNRSSVAAIAEMAEIVRPLAQAYLLR